MNWFFVLSAFGWAAVITNWLLFVGLVVVDAPFGWVAAALLGVVAGLAVALLAAWQYREGSGAEGQDVMEQRWWRETFSVDDEADVDDSPAWYEGRHRGDTR